MTDGQWKLTYAGSGPTPWLLVANSSVNRPCGFSKGILPHLPLPVYQWLIRYIYASSAAGSVVIGDLLTRTFLTHPSNHDILQQLQAMGIDLTIPDDAENLIESADWTSSAFGDDDVTAGRHPLLPGGLPSRLSVSQPGMLYFLSHRYR